MKIAMKIREWTILLAMFAINLKSFMNDVRMYPTMAGKIRTVRLRARPDMGRR